GDGVQGRTQRRFRAARPGRSTRSAAGAGVRADRCVHAPQRWQASPGAVRVSAARTLDVDTMQRQHHAARFLRRAWIAGAAVVRDTRVPGMWLAACMLLSALVMAAALGVRSQVFSLVGVAVVLLVVRQWREGRRGVVWLLPPLFLLWANLDGGFIAGLAVLGVAALVAGPLD